MPRRLTGRIALAFAMLALVTLLTVSAALFVRLHELHETAGSAALSGSATRIVADLRLTPASWDTTLSAAQEQLRELDPDAFVATNPRGGTVTMLDGGALPFAVPQPDSGSNQGSGRVRGSDGRAWLYVVFKRSDAALARTAVLAVPDRATGQTLDDLVHTLPVVLLGLLVVGGPTAWLLSRSVTGPLRRLASAAASVPGSGSPLPIEGPQEVRELTAGFNVMADELAATREREARMLADLRHDLRTPLTSIAGFAEAIVDGTASGDAAGSAAARIVEEAERLDRLVGELGLIERLRSGSAALRPETIDATEILESTRSRFARKAEARSASLEILPSTSDRPLTLAADRLGLERILQNLVENALSAVPSGARIVLRADALEGAGPPSGQPSSIAFSVSDDGPGFPPGTLDRAFERFYRGDPARSKGGSGLGLSIVREIAEAHGGRAWAENLAPHGARVVVALPIIPAATPVGPTAPPAR